MNAETNQQGDVLPEETAQLLESDQTPETVTDADNVDSSTTEGDSSPDENQEADGDATAKPKSKGVQKRIDELVRQRSDVERDRDYWRELAMKSQQPEVKEEPQAPQLPPMPRDIDFDTPEQYQAAVAERDAKIIEMAVERVTQQQTESQQQTAAQERTLKFNQAVDKLAQTHPDAKAVIYGRDSATISQSMADTLLDLENSAEVAYELASKPEEAYRISQLHPDAQKIEIGRLSATVSLPKPKTLSKAPAPIDSKVGGGEPAKVDPDKLSIDEWMEKRRAREI